MTPQQSLPPDEPQLSALAYTKATVYPPRNGATLYPLFAGPAEGPDMMPAAEPTARTRPSGTASTLALTDTIRLADGRLAEHRLLAMASDLWAARPESHDPHWIAAAWNGLTIAYRVDS